MSGVFKATPVTSAVAAPSRNRADLLLWDLCYGRKDVPAFLDKVSLFADAIRAATVPQSIEFTARHPELIAAAKKAQGFALGFVDDKLQEPFISELLTELQAAIAKAEGAA